VVVTVGVDGTVEEDGIDRETLLQWKKVLQNWLPSCARGPKTLGTIWPVMRSTEEGSHRWSATRSSVGVGRVKLELQNIVEKHCKPLAKLRVEGIKERVATAPANQR
jgi:hypothetical protein